MLAETSAYAGVYYYLVVGQAILRHGWRVLYGLYVVWYIVVGFSMRDALRLSLQSVWGSRPALQSSALGVKDADSADRSALQTFD